MSVRPRVAPPVASRAASRRLDAVLRIGVRVPDAHKSLAARLLAELQEEERKAGRTVETPTDPKSDSQSSDVQTLLAELSKARQTLRDCDEEKKALRSEYEQKLAVEKRKEARSTK